VQNPQQGEEIKATVEAKLSIGDLLGALRTIYGLNTERPAAAVSVPSGVGVRQVPPEDLEKK
jgi:hypothetical protein